ncbi:MAG: sulfatase-like hydrolase/transferase [Planctomycetes bacterium]|nr:sulfatase-like hydrolase/transferase [Planctomycetota bacterium]
MLRPAVIFAAFAAFAAAVPSQAAGHNVLIVIADDLGVDQVGAYQEGTNPAPTPTIDALANRGILFRNAWSNPTCSPTRTSINTGRYTFRHKVGDWIMYANNGNRTGTLRARETTIPEALDRAGSGYAHAAFGKWHMNTIQEGPTYPTTVGRWGTYFGSMGGLASYYSWERIVNGAPTWTGTYATTQQVNDALAWIQAQTTPWVCYLAFDAPHTPHHAPPANLHSRNLTGLNPNGSFAEQREFYKAMIEAMDRELGRLFASLGPTVMADTNVIFLADNGTPLGLAEAPFLPTQGKTTPYEGGINVPIIIAGPAVQGAPREETRLVSVVDVFATTLDLAGASGGVPSYVEVDGKSLVPYLQSNSSPTLHDTVFADRYRGDDWPDPIADMSGFGMAMIRNDRFKLISRNTGTDELYDLSTDPFETSNLLLGTLTPLQTQNYSALTAAMVELRTAPRRVFPYGSNACVGTTGTPQLRISGVPRIGSSYSPVLLGGAPGRLCLLGSGFSELSYSGYPLPFDLAILGAGPGCLLQHSIDALSSTITSALGTASVAIPIPNAASLLDLPLYHSFVIQDPGAPGNALGLVTSPAVAVRIGS